VWTSRDGFGHRARREEVLDEFERSGMAAAKGFHDAGLARLWFVAK